MQAGQFDELITVQTYTTVTDSNTGEKLQTWANLTTLWARVDEAPVGIENVNADQRQHKQTVDFITRYDSTVNVRHRIVWNGKYFNIVNIQDQVRRMYMKIQTELSE